MTTTNKKSKAATEFAVFSIATAGLMLIAIILGTEDIYGALACLLIATATMLVSVIAYRDFYEAIEEDVMIDKDRLFHAECDRLYDEMLLAHETEEELYLYEQHCLQQLEDMEREQELNHVCGSKEDYIHE